MTGSVAACAIDPSDNSGSRHSSTPSTNVGTTSSYIGDPDSTLRYRAAMYSVRESNHGAPPSAASAENIRTQPRRRPGRVGVGQSEDALGERDIGGEKHFGRLTCVLSADDGRPIIAQVIDAVPVREIVPVLTDHLVEREKIRVRQHRTDRDVVLTLRNVLPVVQFVELA